jgi:hypothetical protein
MDRGGTAAHSRARTAHRMGQWRWPTSASASRAEGDPTAGGWSPRVDPSHHGPPPLVARCRTHIARSEETLHPRQRRAMLPLSLLRTAAGHPMVRRARTLPLEPKRVWPQILIFFHFCCQLCVSMQLVELKNGETYNGELVACDNWMNIRCTHVHTSRKLPRQRSAHRRLRPTLPHAEPLHSSSRVRVRARPPTCLAQPARGDLHLA